MTSEIVKSDNASYLARYNQDDRDPYEAFASEGGPGIQGKRLSCLKGDWVVGTDQDAVKAGTQCLAIVDTIGRGWLRWRNNVVMDAVFGLVKDGFLMPHRLSLGDEDKGEWEKDPSGNPRDPWSPVYRMLLVEMAAPHGDLTFSSTAWGAKLALQDLAFVYKDERHLYPDAYPIVDLTTKTRNSRSYGLIKGPWFNVVGWTTVADVRTGRKKKLKPVPPRPPAVGEALDDALPDW
jgi:hypothetical protein